MKHILTHIFILSLISPFDLSIYHPQKQIQEIVNEFTNFRDVKLRTCSNDQTYHYLQIGNTPQTPKLAIIQCNVHARQLITGQICLEWVKRTLEQRYNKIKDIGFKVFYRANNQRQTIFFGNNRKRTNRNNVDLNRNFPTQFNFYHVPIQFEIYSGKQSINQPYTICLQQVLEERNPDIFIDVHSGSNGQIFYQEGINNKKQIEIAQGINKQYCNYECRITTLAKDGQSINGHIFADLKVRLKVPISLLFEVYGNKEAKNEILKMFNPENIEKKQKIIEKWSDAIDYVIDSIAIN